MATDKLSFEDAWDRFWNKTIPNWRSLGIEILKIEVTSANSVRFEARFKWKEVDE